MESSQQGAKVHLGKLEWAVVLLLLSGVAWGWQQQISRLGSIEKSVGDLNTQSAVQTGQITTLTTQLADVPRLTREMTETKVRVERLEQDVRDYHGRRNP